MNRNTMITETDKQSLTAKDIMTKNPLCVRETDLAKEIHPLFTKYHITSIPVLDEKGILTGVVTNADIARAKQILDMRDFMDLVFQGTNVNVEHLQEFFHLDMFEEIITKDIMSEKPMTAFEDTPVSQIAKQMYEKREHRVIVLNAHEQVVGIISPLDIVHACYA